MGPSITDYMAGFGVTELAVFGALVVYELAKSAATKVWGKGKGDN